MLLRLLRDLVDFCYPGICPVCRAPCAADKFLCHPCLVELTNLEQRAACERCAMPLASEGSPCPFCLGEGVRHYDRILRLGTFQEPLKKLIHQMKYGGRWALGEQLADRLLEQQKIRDLLSATDVIVPVPLHRVRQLGRGYNQAAVIARHLARRAGVRFVSPIARVRNTDTQTRLSRARRELNLRNAFRLKDAAAVAQKRVVVIDDVMTTGATLQTVARTLRRGKPACLTAVVIAIADPKGRDFQVL